MIRFAFQKDYLPPLWKVILDKMKNGRGETKLEVTIIIQMTKNKRSEIEYSCNCEDLRFMDEAELIENDELYSESRLKVENWHWHQNLLRYSHSTTLLE